MSEQTTENEIEEPAEEYAPIYYKPKSLNLVATIAGITSWVVLLGFIAVIIGQFLVLQELGAGAPWSTLLANPQAKNWVYTNMVLPLLNGIGLFILMQGVSIGLNALLEIDFNMREARN